MITIIDYGAGNLRSVQKAFEHLGYSVNISSNPEEIQQAEKVVLPGVGAFGDAMNSIRRSDLYHVIRNKAMDGTPFLGICLGLQLLFDSSTESESATGLHLIPGTVEKIPDCGLKIPQIGWNSITFQSACPLFRTLPEHSYFYFVHSYYVKPEDSSCITATVSYGADLPIAIQKNNLFAVQFHPEKSGETGLALLENFAKL